MAFRATTTTPPPLAAISRVARLPLAARRVAIAAVLAGGGFVAGVVLAAIGVRFGVAATLALPLLPVVAVVTAGARPRAIALFFLSMPVGLAGALPGLQVVEVAVLAAIGLVFALRVAEGEGPFATAPPLRWAVAIAAVGFVASATAVDVGLASRQEFQLIVGVALAYTVVGACRRLGDVRWLVGVFLVVATGMAAYAVANTADLEASHGGAVVSNRSQGIFHQPNELGAFAAMATLVAAGAALGARTRAGRTGASLAMVVSLLALMLSLSRGAWIGAVLGVGVLLVLVPRARRTVALLALPVVGLAALIGVFQPDSPQVQIVRDRLESITGETRNPYDSRPVIWGEAMREMRERPLLGYGPANFPVASERSVTAARAVSASHAHNTLLTTGAELGLPAVGLLVLFTIAVARAAQVAVRRLGRDPDAAILAGLAAALMTVVGHGIVDYPMRNPIAFFLVWALTGLLVAGTRLAPRR